MSDVGPDVGRHAVLVDAGYLYASVGQLVLGRTVRREFRLAAEPLIAALFARAADTTPGALLRMYWYDAARDRVPTVEQRQIAALPHVKVRLGNLNSAGQQKGVDAQLRQDLEELARHRAVTDVVLIAGDEDMVPAVEAAQAYGVRVHVWGVEPPYGVNQAERLVWEADTVDQLDAEFCRPYVEIEPGPEPEAVEHREDKPLMPTPAEVFAARKLPAPAPLPPPVALKPAATPDRPGPERPEMEQIGSRIAARWLLTRGRENVADLLPGPVLPTVIDKELLVEAEEEISRSLRPYEEARRALRDGFWARLHQEFGLSSTPPHPAAHSTSSAPTGTDGSHPAGTPAASAGPDQGHAVGPDRARTVDAVGPDRARTAAAAGPDHARTVDAVGPDHARTAAAAGPDRARTADAAGPDRARTADAAGSSGTTAAAVTAPVPAKPPVPLAVPSHPAPAHASPAAHTGPGADSTASGPSPAAHTGSGVGPTALGSSGAGTRPPAAGAPGSPDATHASA